MYVDIEMKKTTRPARDEETDEEPELEVETTQQKMLIGKVRRSISLTTGFSPLARPVFAPSEGVNASRTLADESSPTTSIRCPSCSVRATALSPATTRRSCSDLGSALTTRHARLSVPPSLQSLPPHSRLVSEPPCSLVSRSLAQRCRRPLWYCAGRLLRHQRQREGADRSGEDEHEPRVRVPEEAAEQILVHRRGARAPSSARKPRSLLRSFTVLCAFPEAWHTPACGGRTRLLRCLAA